MNSEVSQKFLKAEPGKLTKEDMRELKEYMQAYDAKWVENLRHFMKEDPVLKIRYAAEPEGLMPIGDVYRLANGITRNTVLRGLFIKHCVNYIEQLTSKVA